MKKKLDVKTIIIIALCAVLLIAIAALAIIKIVDAKKLGMVQAELVSAREDVSALQTEVDALGETQLVYRLRTDLGYNVKSGEKCTSDMLETAAVPISMANGYDTTDADIVEKYFLVDMEPGQVVNKNDVFDVAIKQDDRYLDVICDRQPIGILPGDTVDIRITFPDGQDYLLLDGKYVNSVYGNVVKVLVDEKDIIIYNGAEADWCRFYKNGDLGTAVRVYCTQHVAGGLQSADRYYPIADKLPDGETYEGSVLWTATNDLNLSEKDLSDWLLVDRKQFEESLEYYDYYRTMSTTYELVIRMADGEEETVEHVFTEYENINDWLKDAFPSASLIKSTVLEKDIALDMNKGSEAVANAKLYRDGIYNNGVEEYNKSKEVYMKWYDAQIEVGVPANELLSYEEWYRAGNYSTAVFNQDKEENGDLSQEASEGVAF